MLKQVYYKLSHGGLYSDNTENQRDQTVFQLPTSLYTCTEDLHKSTISIKLMPDDANPQLIPMETVGDGNCLFRSLSLMLFGNKDNHSECRVRTVVELSSNAHL